MRGGEDGSGIQPTLNLHQGGPNSNLVVQGRTLPLRLASDTTTKSPNTAPAAESRNSHSEGGIYCPGAERSGMNEGGRQNSTES